MFSRMLVALVLVVAMTSFSFADILVGDWENTSDGWVASTAALGYGYQIGNTLNNYSLKVVPASGYWQMAFSSNWMSVLNATAAKALMANNPVTFSIDVTLKASEWVTNYDVLPCTQIALQDNVNSWGWQQIDNTWTWNPSKGDVTKTLSVTFPTQGVLDSFRFMIFEDCGSPTVKGNIYYDNARLTPEPATMCLLGLGGLALIRRKK